MLMLEVIVAQLAVLDENVILGEAAVLVAKRLLRLHLFLSLHVKLLH